jgi:pSer/pThr/pTyr-binding forkhead associated (FHA) protein
MDDPKQPGEVTGLHLQGPHWKNPATPNAAPVVPPLRLVLQPGGMSVEVNRPENLIGRHSSADICLRLPDVSRRHCRLVFADDRWTIQDLHSLNGTLVNHEPVDEAVLQHKDTVQIGSYLFEVDLQPGKPTLQLPGAAPRSAEQILESISEALAFPAPPPNETKRAS